MYKNSEEIKEKKKQLVEFYEINFMRKQLGMPLLEKGYIKCIGGCDKEFFSFDKKGNRLCDFCKSRPRGNSYDDSEDIIYKTPGL